MTMVIENVVKFVIAAVVGYMVFVMAGALSGTFGIISGVMFFIKACHSILTEEAISEPRTIAFIFGLSIVSGAVGMIFFDHVLPPLFRGDFLTAGLTVVIIIVAYFSWKGQLQDAWNRRSR